MNVSDNCRDLLLRLLTRDPRKRIPFDDFFTHPFLDLKHAPSDSSLPKAVSTLIFLSFGTKKVCANNVDPDQAVLKSTLL